MKCDGNLHGPRLKTLVLRNIQNSLELGRTWTERQFSFFCEFEFGQVVKFVAKSCVQFLNVVHSREQDCKIRLMLP